MREFLKSVHNLTLVFTLALISLYRIQKWISTGRTISMLSRFGLCRLLQAWMDSSLSDPCLSNRSLWNYRSYHKLSVSVR